MKICPNCKSQNFDVKTACERCGCPLPKNQFETVVAHPNNTTSQPVSTSFYVISTPSQNRALRTVASVFLIISCVLSAIAAFTMFVLWTVSIVSEIKFLATMYLILALIGLIHMIVGICMTVKYQTKTSGNGNVGVGFKICTLLFVNAVAGILMLCDNN